MTCKLPLFLLVNMFTLAGPECHRTEKYLQHLIHLCKFVPNCVPAMRMFSLGPSKASDCRRVGLGLSGCPVNKTHGTKGGSFLAHVVLPVKGNFENKKTVGVISAIKQLILFPLCKRPRSKRAQTLALCAQRASNAVGCLTAGWFHWNPAVIPSLIGYDAVGMVFVDLL